MIIFNCSHLAAGHLCKGYKKGSDEGFFQPVTTNTLAEQQRGGRCFQWVLHAIKLGHSSSVIAMEYETRYCHVIHQVKKGDVQGFFNRLQDRLLNGLAWQCLDYSLLDEKEMDAGIEHYMCRHKSICFYQQTDKNVMSHINQVSAEYKDAYYDNGGFPPDEETALAFDIRLNQNWRSRKGEEYGLQVNEKMIHRWLVEYQCFPAKRINDAMVQIKDIERKRWNDDFAQIPENHSKPDET